MWHLSGRQSKHRSLTNFKSLQTLGMSISMKRGRNPKKGVNHLRRGTRPHFTLNLVLPKFFGHVVGRPSYFLFPFLVSTVWLHTTNCLCWPQDQPRREKKTYFIFIFRVFRVPWYSYLRNHSSKAGNADLYERVKNASFTILL